MGYLQCGTGDSPDGDGVTVGRLIVADCTAWRFTGWLVTGGGRVAYRIGTQLNAAAARLRALASSGSPSGATRWQHRIQDIQRKQHNYWVTQCTCMALSPNYTSHISRLPSVECHLAAARLQQSRHPCSPFPQSLVQWSTSPARDNDAAKPQAKQRFPGVRGYSRQRPGPRSIAAY